jgi:hypothetical protein
MSLIILRDYIKFLPATHAKAVRKTVELGKKISFKGIVGPD